MPDFHGPIQHVTIARALWTLLAPSLLATLFCTWMALTRRANGRAVTVASVGAIGLAFASSVAHVALLATKPESDRYFLEHLWRMVRVGQLDASFDLALDPLAATMTVVVTGIGLATFVFAAATMQDDAAYARLFAWLNALVLAMLVLVLADGFVLLFFGWEGVALAAWGLIALASRSGPSANAGRHAFVVGRVGDVALVMAVALLYWGLGGTWTDGDYVPDLSARFSSVEVRDGQDEPEAAPLLSPAPLELPRDEDADEDEERAIATPTHGGGFLTLTSYSGAVVFMDDARTPIQRAPGVSLTAPFTRFPVKGGAHSFRVHPGGGLDDFLVTHVGFSEGRELALASFGPTVTFRNLHDQLVARDARGRAPFAEALADKRGWGRCGLVTLACLLLFAACAAKSAELPFFLWLPDAARAPVPAAALIQSATTATAGVYLLARLSFLFALSPVASAMVACAGAGTALLAATMALYPYDLKRVLACAGISQLGIATLAVGAGACSSSVFHLVTYACFSALLLLAGGAATSALRAVEADAHSAQDLRHMGGLARALPRTALAYRVGCFAIAAAPVPGFAGFWSQNEVLARVFTARAPLVPAVTFGVAAFAALVASGVVSFAVWRTYYLVFEGEPRERIDELLEPPRLATHVTTALAVLCVVVGVVLGVSPRLIGRGGESLLEDWLAPSLRDVRSASADGGAVIFWGGVLVAYAVGLGGWALARSRYATRAHGWQARERRSPLFRASTNGWWLDAIVAHALVPFVRGAGARVAELDRRVVDGAAHLVALVARVTAWITGRADDALVDGAVRGVSHATLFAGERVRALHTGRVQTYATAIALGVLAVAFLQYWLR